MAAGLAITLIVLAVPRLTSAVGALNAEDVLWNARAGAAVPADSLVRAGTDLSRASDGETLNDAGFLLYRASEAGVQRDGLLAGAQAATMAGLARAPANASAWARLAMLRDGAGDRPGAVAALRLSLLTGAVVPALTRSRLELGLQLLDSLDDDTRQLLDRQIRIAWVLMPQMVAALSRDDANAALIKNALDALSARDLEQYRRLHPS